MKENMVDKIRQVVLRIIYRNEQFAKHETLGSGGKVKEYLNDIYTFIYTYNNARNVFTTLTWDGVKELWRSIRSNSSHTSFILQVGTELRALYVKEEWDTLLFNLSSSYSIAAYTEYNVMKAVDDQLIDDLLDNETLFNILQENKWLVALLLISIMDPIE